MFKQLVLCLTLAALLAGCHSNSHAKKELAMDECCAEGAAKVRHVVLFRFKPGTPPETVKEIETRFAKLSKEVPTIIGYEWGTNISSEGFDRGYTHCFFVTFKDTAGRDAYLPHPAHKAFVDFLLPHLDEAHVLDYAVRE